jgi:hypothetical protein
LASGSEVDGSPGAAVDHVDYTQKPCSWQVRR